MTNPESALSHREESISDADSRRRDVPRSSGWAPDSTALRLRARFRTSSLRNHLILKVTSREGLAPHYILIAMAERSIGAVRTAIFWLVFLLHTSWLHSSSTHVSDQAGI